MSASSSSWSATSAFSGAPSPLPRSYEPCPGRPSACRPTTSARTSSRWSRALLERLGPDGRVLVIDDSSPDGTGEIADRLAAEHDRVAVLHRPPKEGLGPGVPRRLPARARRRRRAGARDGLRLLARPGRRAPADRRRGGRRPRARLALRPRRPGRELGTGAPLRLPGRLAVRAGAAPRSGPRPDRRLQVLPPRGARADRPRRRHPRGYAFQIETTYRALRAGFRVVEVPITFADREAGGSKMSRSIVLEAIWRVPYLGALGAASGG